MPNILSYVAILCCASSLLAAESDSSMTVTDISREWKFFLGDDPERSDPYLDDSHWQSISVGSPWEEQGHSDYDGFGWYRLHVRIPSAFRDHPDLQRFGFMRLTIGKIDDVDQTWWNGHLIGETGQMPDSYATQWSTDRTYRIPTQMIRWDADNVIAVRVFDGQGPGGMYEGPYSLGIPSWQDLVSMEISMGRGDGIFMEPDGLPVSSLVYNESSKRLAGRVQWFIENDEGKQLAKESSEVALAAQGEQSVECDFSPTEPGFYRVKCNFQRQTNTADVMDSKVLGYRPEEVETNLTRETDFDQFWKQTLEELATVEPQFELTPMPEQGTATHDVFEVSMRSLGGVRVRGWYERPKSKGLHPALLRVPGYTQAMQPSGITDPWAVLSFNIRAHGNSQEDVSGIPADYWIRGLDDKNEYFYRGAYSDCIRAVDFLVSREEVDASRIAVTGGSQGGGLSLVTAGLDQRISLCAPDIPFLCNWARYFKTSSWPEMESWIAAEEDRSWEKTLRTMSYFDALNLADRIKCPVFLGAGLQDDVCPPATIFAVYNKLTCPKEFRVYPQAGHWVGESHHARRREWLMQHFAMDGSNDDSPVVSSSQ